MRETWLFTHARAALRSKIIFLCAHGVAVHVYAVPGSDVPCPCAIAPSAPPARELLPCPVPNPQLTPDTLSILTLLTSHHSPSALSIPLSFPHPPSPILATFLSMACVLKRFPLTSPRKLALTCVKRPVLRTSGWTSLVRGCDETVMMHCLFLPKISIFGHQNAGLV